MAIISWNKQKNDSLVTSPILKGLQNPDLSDDGKFKAYIPGFLYNPPYGLPRKVDVLRLKNLAKNPYIFSVIKTIADEVTSAPWVIRVKEEFQDVTIGAEGTPDHSTKIKEITRFMKNPNGNDESGASIMRQVTTGILELDAGIIVKVFNEKGELRHLLSRDGGTFLKNPDIYGYMGNRSEFVAPLPDGFERISLDPSLPARNIQQELVKKYEVLFRNSAAYFQYGWTAGSMPVPFGKREIVYFSQQPRYDNVYGRSPLEILETVILSLVYGSEFNLDFYTNNNMPDGVIQLLGANNDQIEQYRQNMESKFRFTDEFQMKRKTFYSMPIVNSETKFTPFQLSSKEMEVISQQQWFIKLVWACFGVTPEEMGFTEDSNRATSQESSKVSRRRALKPLLNVIAYHYNSQIIPEFFAKEGVAPSFSDIPLEFAFEEYDLDDDLKLHSLYQLQIIMGVKTPEMVAKELGIDLSELEESKKKQRELLVEDTGALSEATSNDIPVKKEEKKEKVQEKAQDSEKELVSSFGASLEVAKAEVLAYIDGLSEEMITS